MIETVIQIIDGIPVEMSADEIAELEEARANVEFIPIVNAVSARQFKLQLLAADLLEDVDAWVATQDRATQIAYEYSGTFVKDSSMMAAGFAAMGFTLEQVDAFFTAAAQI